MTVCNGIASPPKGAPSHSPAAVTALALTNILITCAAGGTALAQSPAPATSDLVDAAPAALIVTPHPNSAPALPKFLDDRRLRAIETQARPMFEANEQRRAEKLKRKAIEADLKRNAENVRRAVDSLAQSGTVAGAAAFPTGTIIDIIGPAQAAAAPMPLPAVSPSTASPSAATPPAASPPPPPVRAAIGGALPRLPGITSPATAPPATDPHITAGAQACGEPAITAEPLPGGRVEIAVAADCRKGETATIRYTPYVFLRPVGPDGRLRFVLDLFQGADAEISVAFADGSEFPVELGQTDLDRVSKVAVIWGKPVNLDLHVFEYAAAPGGPGHIWSRSPSDAEAARNESRSAQRGRGFLSFASNGTEPGHQVEVYTLWHHDGQTGGVVATALDYETRGAAGSGETCGDGALARIPYETIALQPGRPAVRERGVISSAPCDAALVEKARYQDEAISDLPLRLD